MFPSGRLPVPTPATENRVPSGTRFFSGLKSSAHMLLGEVSRTHAHADARSRRCAARAMLACDDVTSAATPRGLRKKFLAPRAGADTPRGACASGRKRLANGAPLAVQKEPNADSTRHAIGASQETPSFEPKALSRSRRSHVKQGCKTSYGTSRPTALCCRLGRRLGWNHPFNEGDSEPVQNSHSPRRFASNCWEKRNYRRTIG